MKLTEGSIVAVMNDKEFDECIKFGEWLKCKTMGEVIFIWWLMKQVCLN